MILTVREVVKTSDNTILLKITPVIEKFKWCLSRRPFE